MLLAVRPAVVSAARASVMENCPETVGGDVVATESSQKGWFSIAGCEEYWYFMCADSKDEGKDDEALVRCDDPADVASDPKYYAYLSDKCPAKPPPGPYDCQSIRIQDINIPRPDCVKKCEQAIASGEDFEPTSDCTDNSGDRFGKANEDSRSFGGKIM